MKDGIAILSLILFMLWLTWLERRTRGVVYWAAFAAPVVGFFFGWWAR